MTLTPPYSRDPQHYGIRAAPPHDAQACRMLLPHLGVANADFVTVVERATERVVGAGAVTHAMRQVASARGPGVGFHVIPPCRGYGLGNRLLGELLRLAARRHAEAVYAAQRVDLESDAFAHWQQFGFEVCETVEEHDLPLADIEPLLAPLADWMQRRNEVPAAAKLIPLYAAQAAQVVRLHLEHLGGDRNDLLERISSPGVRSFHPRYSMVATVGDEIAGCLLARRVSELTAVVDAIVVAPDYRRGWANLLLKLHATRGAREIGVRHFRFTSFDRYDDTRAFARRLGGAVTVRKALMMRSLITKQVS